MSAPNRVVLITGASSGIGQACAEQLSKSGWRVFGTSREAPPVPALDGLFTMLRMDVTDTSSVEAALRFVMEREGRVDAVINNAGIALAGAVEDTTLDEGRIVWETNFIGVARVCRAVLPALRASRGCVINVSSLGGLVALPFQAFYSASKFALEGYTEALRAEVREHGVRVILVEPGDFQTGMTAQRRIALAAAESAVYGTAFKTALEIISKNEQRGSSPEKIGRLVERILTESNPKCRYRTGSAIELLLMRIYDWLPESMAAWTMRKYYGLR